MTDPARYHRHDGSDHVYSFPCNDDKRTGAHEVVVIDVDDLAEREAAAEKRGEERVRAAVEAVLRKNLDDTDGLYHGASAHQLRAALTERPQP